MTKYKEEAQELAMLSGMLSRSASDCEEFSDAFTGCCRSDDMEVIGRRAQMLAQELSEAAKKLAASAGRIEETGR